MSELETNPSVSSSGPGSSAPSSGPSTESTAEPRERRAEAIHDFAGKLRQPSSWPRVVDYVNWQRELRAARRDGSPEPAMPSLVPISINLDLTTACNYACDHCIDWEILNSKVRHRDEELRASMALMAERGMRSVILIGGGEPTLYPGFASFVEHLKTLGLQVAVVSNGSRNDRVLQAAQYLEAGDWVRLSLDAGSNDVFQRMHNPSRKGLTLDEICAWIPKIKEANPDLAMGFSFVITWRGGKRDEVGIIENIDEMVSAARRARDAGFDYISFKPFLQRSESGSEVLEPEQAEQRLATVLRRIREKVNAARELERPGFKVMESTNLRMLEQGSWRDFTRQPHMCHFQALRQVLTPLGLYNCPAHRGVARARIDEKDAYVDGKAAGHAAEETARILDQFDAASECSQVTCLYNGANWFLERLIESDQDPRALQLEGDTGDFFL